MLRVLGVLSQIGILFLLFAYSNCDSALNPYKKKLSNETNDLGTWIPNGNANLQTPCKDRGRGNFPDVFFFRGKLWCAIQADGKIHIAALAEDLLPVSVQTIDLPAGTLAFPKFGVANGQLYLAHSSHNPNNTDNVVLRNLDTGSVEDLGPGVGVHPIGLGHGSVAWTTPANEVAVRPITGGNLSIRYLQTSQGIAYLSSSTEAVTGDENRLSAAGGLTPCWAGNNFVGVVPPADSMIVRRIDTNQEILFWNGLQAFDPRCTEVPGGWAISSWGPNQPGYSNFVGLRVFRPSDFN